MVNTIEGIYKSPATGDSLPIDEAINKGLIAGALLCTRTKREILPKEPEFMEKRCYTITHAKDTDTGERTSGELCKEIENLKLASILRSNMYQ